MYYVGRKPLRTNDGMKYPGDALPEATSWKPNVLRAHLSAETVVMSGNPDEIQERYKKQWAEATKTPEKQEPTKEKVLPEGTKPEPEPEPKPTNDNSGKGKPGPKASKNNGSKGGKTNSKNKR